MDILEEAKKEDLAKRIGEFQAGLKELMEKTKIKMKPQITPDGPIINLIDTKYENPTPVQ